MDIENCGALHGPSRQLRGMGTVSQDELRALVCEWTLMLKEGGLPPEKALVSVKTLVREAIAPHISSYAGVDLAERPVALLADASQWCIEAYFGKAPPQGARINTRRGDATARRSLSRALLLKLLVMHPELTSATLAERLMVDPRQLAVFASGTQLMPIDVQEQLADFIAVYEPRLARLAKRLRLQAQAARRYQAGEVVRHMTSPPRPW